MSENAISGIMDVTMEKIRSMVDAQTIIGDPMKVDDVTIIPVSKVSFGLATGGSDFKGKTDKIMFGGGGGAGVSISPISFLVIKNSEVKMLNVVKQETSTDRAIALVPELFDKITDLFKKDNKETDNK